MGIKSKTKLYIHEYVLGGKLTRAISTNPNETIIDYSLPLSPLPGTGDRRQKPIRSSEIDVFTATLEIESVSKSSSNGVGDWWNLKVITSSIPLLQTVTISADSSFILEAITKQALNGTTISGKFKLSKSGFHRIKWE